MLKHDRVRHVRLQITVTSPQRLIVAMDKHHLLRSFSNVKYLRIDRGHIIKELSRGLNSEDGELPLKLLPELQELPCFGIGGFVWCI